MSFLFFFSSLPYHALSLLLFHISFSFFSLSFFIFFFLYLFFPYPSSTEFFWLDLRKFPPSFPSLSHGHLSSHGPSIMCHMDTCFRGHLQHHMDLMPCVLLPWFLWSCHVAPPYVSHDTQCVEKREIPTISEFNKI